MYTLEEVLASGKGIPHWHPRSRIGLYLGPSPRHARTVGLVLNLQLTSLQFHVSYDKFFDKVRPTSENAETISLWRQKSGFCRKINTDPSNSNAETNNVDNL